MKGTVIKNTGSSFLVKTDQGPVLDCKIKGNFRIRGLRSTSPVAIGDRVTVNQSDSIPFISEVDERRNYIVRKPTNLSKQLHIIAANIDVALLVVTVNHPQTNLVFVDRFLATAQAYRVPAALLFNKTDLYEGAEREYQEAVCQLYTGIGYPCFRLSALTGEGIAGLRAFVEGKMCLLSGNSGVGKSSLLNALCPGARAKTGAISDSHDKGMHTTSFSEMFELSENTYIIDTPGIKGFNTVDMKPEEVGHYFPEIFRESSHCRYGNCTHRHEPGCAVLQALAEHRLSESRYNSYLSILEDFGEGKYRSEF